FQANQGLLLAGAVAYYALLSIVPLLILMVIALSQVIDQDVLLATLDRALEYVVPGKGKAVVVELRAFLDHRKVIGWVLSITLLFFSSLGFKVLENAISVIFLHRVQERRRHLLVSLLLLPFGYIFFIGAVLFVGTFVIVDLVAMGGEHVVILGHTWSLGGFSRWLIYVAGVTGEILLISAIYYFMPVGRLTARHALVGGVTAGLLWEIIRHGLGWFFGTLSQVSVVYGSLATAIIVLLSLEVAAALLLLGAQVIAEYERIEIGKTPKQPVSMHTEAT
ncbi:MAG: YihY/virulence factor BrkB family protein, partial [Sideroxyarcus sp.]|nr:YihY/virulence factor BrkB family protein [Sideroxyarcus sp.]